MNWWRLCLAAPPLPALTSPSCSGLGIINNPYWLAGSTCPETQGALHFFPRAGLRRTVCVEGDCRVWPHSLPTQTPSACQVSSPSLLLFLCLEACWSSGPEVPMFSQGSTGYLSELWHSTEYKHQKTWIPIPAGPHTGCGNRKVTKSPWACISPSEKWAW